MSYVVYCPEHPRYRVLRKPRLACLSCWAAYIYRYPEEIYLDCRKEKK